MLTLLPLAFRLIFTFQEGFQLVYKQWGFSTLQLGWTFWPINVGYLIAYLSYFPWIQRDRRAFKTKGPDAVAPERRLWWLLYLAPLEAIGLFGFAWSSLGPPRVHWSVSTYHDKVDAVLIANIMDPGSLL